MSYRRYWTFESEETKILMTNRKYGVRNIYLLCNTQICHPASAAHALPSSPKAAPAGSSADSGLPGARMLGYQARTFSCRRCCRCRWSDDVDDKVRWRPSSASKHCVVYTSLSFSAPQPALPSKMPRLAGRAPLLVFLAHST